MRKSLVVWAAGLLGMFVLVGACGTSNETIPVSDEDTSDATVTDTGADTGLIDLGDALTVENDASLNDAADAAKEASASSDGGVTPDVCDGGTAQSLCPSKSMCVAATSCADCEANTIPCPIKGTAGFTCVSAINCLSASNDCKSGLDVCNDGQVCATVSGFSRCAPCVNVPFAGLTLEGLPCKGGGTCQSGVCK